MMEVLGEVNHQKLKKVFLYSPFADHDKKLLAEMMTDTGFSKEKVEKWFAIMRQRMNVDKFLKLKNVQKMEDHADNKCHT